MPFHVLGAGEETWVEGLWVEHMDELEARGVAVKSYREKTLRLKLMTEPHGVKALGELMRHHAQLKTKLAPIIAHHLLSLDEPEGVDKNLKAFSQSLKLSWDAALKQKVEKSTTYYEFTWPQIELAMRQGEYGKAEQQLLDILWDYPGDEKSLRYLAQLYLFNHEWRLADIVYELLQTMGREDLEILNNRILLGIKLHGVEQGIEPLESLEERYPNVSAIIQNRAVLAAAFVDEEHGLLLAGKWAQIDRKNPEALKHYGQLLLHSQNWIFARDAFTRAIRLRPEATDLGALWGLAQAEAGLGELKRSARIIQDIKAVSSPEEFHKNITSLLLPEELVAQFVKRNT